jgi:uncharacterized membrane protein YdcZ (DUF606 family)
MTSRQIAGECGVSFRTVEKVLALIRERLGAQTTAQAIVMAIALELLILDHEGRTHIPPATNANLGSLTSGWMRPRESLKSFIAA